MVSNATCIYPSPLAQIKFWTLKKGTAGKHPGWLFDGSGAAGRFGVQGTHTVTAAAFLPSGIAVTGAATGELCMWKGSALQSAIQGHARGPEIARFDGPIGYFGVRCLVLKRDGKTLLSAGADGFVK